MSMMDNPSGAKKKPTKALRNAKARAKKLSNAAKRAKASLKSAEKRAKEAAKRVAKLGGKKSPTSKKGGKSKPKKTSASRTSRGMYAPYLPTQALTYGSRLPQWAKDLGYTESTIPIVSIPTTPRMGADGKGTGFVRLDKDGNPVLGKDGNPLYEPLPRWMRSFAVDLYGQPAAEAPKKKATKKGDKAKFADLVRKTAEAKGKWLSLVAAGAPADKQAAAKARYESLEERVLKAEITQMLYVQALKGRSSSEILKDVRKKAEEMIKKGRAPAPVVQAAAQGAVAQTPTPAAVQQAAAAAAAAGTPVTGGPAGARWVMGRGPGGRFTGRKQVTPNPYDGFGLAMNPYDDDDDDLYMNPTIASGAEPIEVDVHGLTPGGKKVRAYMSEALPGATNAVDVIVGPQMKRVILTLKEVQKNGVDFLEKNMRHNGRRKLKNNPLGSDLMELGRPVLGATAGFAVSRAVNALALWGLSKTKMDLSGAGAQIGIRAATTGLGVAATLMYGDKLGTVISENRTSIATGMVLNVLEATVRGLVAPRLGADTNEWLRLAAMGDSGYYDVSHAGAPYSPMMGEYVSQSLNGGMGSYIAQAAAGVGEYVSQSLNGGMGEYVSQSLNGGDGLGEYVSQSLNGLGMYAEGVDPSDQEGVDSMINTAESVAGLGTTQVMAATAGLGATQVMAATAGLGATQGMNRGVVTRRGVYNFFVDPIPAGGSRIPSVSIEDAPMPVVGMGPAVPGAVPIGDNVATPEGRGYGGGLFGRHLFGTMV